MPGYLAVPTRWQGFCQNDFPAPTGCTLSMMLKRQEMLQRLSPAHQPCTEIWKLLGIASYPRHIDTRSNCHHCIRRSFSACVIRTRRNGLLQRIVTHVYDVTPKGQLRKEILAEYGPGGDELREIHPSSFDGKVGDRWYRHADGCIARR
ncbi:uncharacterized protein [Dermacentor albipictus]